MDVDGELCLCIDRLSTHLIRLDDALFKKRFELEQECTQLALLFQPWITAQSPLSRCEIQPVNPAGQLPIVKPISTENVDSEWQETAEMRRLSLLLERVHKVRSGVQDEEVREMCNIDEAKSIRMLENLNTSSTTTKMADTKSKPIKKNNIVSKHSVSVASQQRKEHLTTTYSVSFTKPSLKIKSVTAASGTRNQSQHCNAAKQMTLVSKNTESTQSGFEDRSTICKKQTVTDNVAQPGNRGKPGYAHKVHSTAVTEPQISSLPLVAKDRGGARVPLYTDGDFSLLQHGCTIDVPKMMKGIIHKHDLLLIKVKEQGKVIQTMTSMSLKLAAYFDSQESRSET